MRYFIFLLLFWGGFAANAQTAITCTDTTVAMVTQGNYNPAAYLATTVFNHPDTISRGINARVSPDSVRAYLEVLKSFKNRNTGSDTNSATYGIGAARRWAYSKFQQFSQQNENRLLPAYLQFNVAICSITQHRNIMAVLPGMDTSDKSVIIIEGHIDSRCEVLCDTACAAQGMEDNGSGSALVLELARVMSRYSYSHTIVFLLTIGEEQGLYGGQAMASYALLHGIKIKGVLNNDIVGGIICGHTSSAPSCPGYEEIDSTQVRLFSFGGFNSPHKQLARFIKLEYKEMLLPFVSVPMTLSVMTPEDRTGRGGDHIPFRSTSSTFTAMRFTSANEAGDANVTSGTYTDRQHTSRDSLGVDITGDGILDSFWVDFDYLARNTVINGNAAGMMGIGPQTPDFTLSTTGANLIINITAHPEYLNYRVGVRTVTNDWDSVYTFTGTLTDTIIVPNGIYYVSVASVDTNGIESLFSREITTTVIDRTADVASKPKVIELLQNKPNPADEATMISVLVNKQVDYKEAYISIHNMAGKEVKRTAITLNTGVNEIVYEHGYNMTGTYIYTLVIDGKEVQSRRMVFAN